MFDYLRNLTKSVEEKQQEALNAYLDNALSPQERQQFEQLLARDADLRQEVEARRVLQAQMRQMPRRRVPRNFTLDPAVYGRPQRQPLFQLYPAMQAAAVLTAIFFILAIGADLFLYQAGSMATSAPQDVAMVEEAMEEPAEEAAVEEAPLAAQAVEVTRIVTETVVEDTAVTEEMAAAEVEEEAPPPLPTDTITTAADAAGGEADEALATASPLPTPSPAATQAALATVDATKSTVPRPEAETVTGERAMTTVPTAQPQVADGRMNGEATAVPTPTPSREPVSGLRWLQIGLGALLVVLGTAVFYVRRQS